MKFCLMFSHSCIFFTRSQRNMWWLSVIGIHVLTKERMRSLNDLILSVWVSLPVFRMRQLNSYFIYLFPCLFVINCSSTWCLTSNRPNATIIGIYDSMVRLNFVPGKSSNNVILVIEEFVELLSNDNVVICSVVFDHI